MLAAERLRSAVRAVQVLAQRATHLLSPRTHSCPQLRSVCAGPAAAAHRSKQQPSKQTLRPALNARLLSTVLVVVQQVDSTSPLDCGGNPAQSVGDCPCSDAA